MARSVRPALVLASALCATGCPNYLFEQKVPNEVHEKQIVRGGAKSPSSDVLLVIDNSGSMEAEEMNLKDNLDKFINALATGTSSGASDYHFGVVTMDLTTQAGEMNGLVKSTWFQNSPYDLTGFFIDDCKPANIPHGCFRGPDPKYRILKASELSKADLISKFRDNVTVGTCGAGVETGLQAVVEALKHAASGDCNDGFLRPDANLVIIIISDDDDEDPILRPPSDFVDQLAQLKDISKVRFANIGGYVNGQPTHCRNPLNAMCGQQICMNPPLMGDHMPCGTAMPNACAGPSGMYPEGEFCQLAPQSAMGQCENKQLQYFTPFQCNLCEFFNGADCCVGSPSPRYLSYGEEIERRVHEAIPAISITGCQAMTGKSTSCLAESICQDNYSDTLIRIAHELLVTTQFFLVPRAIYPPGIVVKVIGGRFGPDGTTLMYGTDFTVTADGSELMITNVDKAPQGDEQIEIYFIVSN
jgi:hypothetical protein